MWHTDGLHLSGISDALSAWEVKINNISCLKMNSTVLIVLIFNYIESFFSPLCFCNELIYYILTATCWLLWPSIECLNIIVLIVFINKHIHEFWLQSARFWTKNGTNFQIFPSLHRLARWNLTTVNECDQSQIYIPKLILNSVN